MSATSATRLFWLANKEANPRRQVAKARSCAARGSPSLWTVPRRCCCSPAEVSSPACCPCRKDAAHQLASLSKRGRYQAPSDGQMCRLPLFP